MTDPQMLSLVERVEKATAADSNLDAEIALACGWDQDANGDWHQVAIFFTDGVLRRTAYAVDLPPFTRSFDAAVTLGTADTLLCMKQLWDGADKKVWQASVNVYSPAPRLWIGSSTGLNASDARAAVAALLRARLTPKDATDAG